MLHDVISCPPEPNYVIFSKAGKNYVVNTEKYDDTFSIKDPRIVDSPKESLSARETGIDKFIKNNRVLSIVKSFGPDTEIEVFDASDLIGEGSFGSVYDVKMTNHDTNACTDKAGNEIKYAVKIPKKTDDLESDQFNDIKKSQLLIKEMVSFTKKTGICATLQTLELMVPIIKKVNVILSSGEKQDAMLMIKVDGKNGYDAIFGDESLEPIEGYNVKVYVDDERYYCVVDPNISLWIALQKIFTLRGLHDLGLVYGDVKIKNVMIQKENGEYIVRLIDIGSINQNGRLSGIFSTRTATPEGFIGDVDSEKYAWNPKFDVFANAVDLPYIFFGSIAEKYFPEFYTYAESSSEETLASFNRIKRKTQLSEKYGKLKNTFAKNLSTKKKHDERIESEKSHFISSKDEKIFNEKEDESEEYLLLSDIFSEYEYADSDDVEETLREYEQDGFEKPNFSSPNFPENMTDAQKIRYIHWHLGFLKTNRDIESGTGKNGEKGKGVYPTEVIHSLSLLQMYSTDPDPEKRISSRVVERVLLHLKMTVDQWKDGQYRIEGMDDDDLNENEREAANIILPKNKANKKNKS